MIHHTCPHTRVTSSKSFLEVLEYYNLAGKIVTGGLVPTLVDQDPGGETDQVVASGPSFFKPKPNLFSSYNGPIKQKNIFKYF